MLPTHLCIVAMKVFLIFVFVCKIAAANIKSDDSIIQIQKENSAKLLGINKDTLSDPSIYNHLGGFDKIRNSRGPLRQMFEPFETIKDDRLRDSGTFLPAAIIGFYTFRCNRYEIFIWKPYVVIGSPLFLTPMIKEGKIKEAQAAAKVDLDGYSDVNSYSGYLTVGLEGCGSNLFFWFFPAMVCKKIFFASCIL